MCTHPTNNNRFSRWTALAGILLFAGVPAPAAAPTAGTPESEVAAVAPVAEPETITLQSDEKEPIPGTADVSVSPDGKVEMHVRDLDLGTVLQLLSMQSRRNIVAGQNVTGTVTANLYNVTFEEALTAVLDGNNCVWRERGQFIYVYTADELTQMEKAAKPIGSRLFRLRYTRAADIQTMIQPLLSDEGKLSVTPDAQTGVGTDANSAGGDGLAVNDHLLVVDRPENLDRIAQAIAEMDVRPTQLLVEATILRAQLNEDNALGIDFNFLGGVTFEDLTSESPGITDITTGNLPVNLMNGTNITNRTDFTDAVPDGGFTFGFIKGSASLFVRALEGITDTVVLANPKILVLNKQRGEVIVGRRDGYLTTTVTETAAVQTVEFLETGTQLVFRPYVGEDDHIRMEIHPKDSTGGLTAANLPFEQTTEVTTNVLIQDGHTIVIGGLFREVTQASRSQVPLVGNIPVAGALFRNSRDNTQREEVVVLLTVHIIKNDQAANEAGMAALNNIESYRVGMREGVLFSGRERLAQAHYRWAMEHLSHGRRDQALWDLGLALNNNPKMLPAMQIREELTAQRMWDEEGSGIRNFLQSQIARDLGQRFPNYGRPEPELKVPELDGPQGFEQSDDQGNSTEVKP